MIYVIRHIQTDWNVEKRTQGSIETSLNEIGRKQAETVKQSFRAFCLLKTSLAVTCNYQSFVI